MSRLATCVKLTLPWFVLLISGCAVMRIDVDVYKGPLANHEYVQLQQMATLAIGAKPLLIQLRDQLLWGERGCECLPRDKGANGKWEPWENGEQCGTGYEKGGYPKLVPDSSTPKVPRNTLIAMCRQLATAAKWYPADRAFIFKLPPTAETQARRVNSVLALYDEVGNKTIQRYVSTTSEISDNLESAFAIYAPNDEKQRKDWKDIEVGLFRSADEFEKVRRLPGAGELFTEYKNFVQALLLPSTPERTQESTPEVDQVRRASKKQFQQLIPPNPKFEQYSKDINEAVVGLSSVFTGPTGKKTFATESEKTEAKNRITQIKAQCTEESVDKRSALESFSNPAIVECYANVLFKNPADSHAQLFKERILGSARALLKIQQLLLQLYGETLAVLKETPDDTRDPRVTEALASIIGNLTQPRNLAVALQVQSDNSIAKDFKKLLEPYPETKGLRDLPENLLWTPGQYEMAQQGLTRTLRERPRDAAKALLSLHFLLIGANEKDVETSLTRWPGYIADYANDKRRSGGIVRGKSLSREDVTLLQDTVVKIAQALSKVQSIGTVAASEGLDRGRSPLGLEDLIEKFQEQKPTGSNKKPNPMYEPAKLDLSNALIGFSEKMLILANNKDLLDQTSKRELDKYVLVLQAIGNSIQSQVDEMYYRKQHVDRLTDNGPAEAVAFSNAVGKSSADVLTAILTDMKDKRRQAQEKQKGQEEQLKLLKLQIEKLGGKIPPQAEGDAGFTLEEKRKALAAASEGLRPLRPLMSAYRMMAADGHGADEAPAVFEEMKEEPANVAIDSKRLAESLGSGKLDGSVFVSHMKSWMEEEPKTIPSDFSCGLTPEKDLNEPRPMRIKCSYVFWMAIAAGPTSGFMKSISQDISKISNAAPEQVRSQVYSVLQATLRSQLGNLNRTIDEYKVAEEKETQAKKLLSEYRRTEKDGSDASEAVKQLDAAITSAGNALPFALLQAEKSDALRDPRAAFTAWRTALVDQENAKVLQLDTDSKKEAKRKEIALALAVLDKYSPPSNGQASAGTDNSSADQLHVLDKLIASLRQEYIETLRSSGSDGHAKNVEAALKSAYEQRSGMVYIRPASAYLRSSFAATSLQGDPGLKWDNMLDAQAMRAIPYFGGEYVNWDTERLTILSSIDKQFWQNINSIRVAGAGNTNYAIAKDDIGNWYVKSYSADPTPIIKSAQQLALFSAGGGLNVNLLRQLDLQAKVDSGKANPQEVKELTGLQGQGPKGDAAALTKVYDKYHTEYASRTQKDRDDLKKALDGSALQDKIRAAWAATVSFADDKNAVEKNVFLERLGAQLPDDKSGPLVDAVTALTPKDANAVQDARIASSQIASALKQILRFESYVTAKIRSLTLSDYTDRVKVTEEALHLQEKKIKELKEEKAKLENSSNTSSVPDKEKEIAREEKVLDEKRKDLDSAQARLASAQSNRDGAIRDVTTIACGLVQEFADRRKKATETLEQSILFIGEATTK